MTKEEKIMSKDIVDILNNKNLSSNSKKELFYNKYASYYSQVKIKNKIIFYKKSINGDKNINIIKKENTNYKWLNKVINIYYSNLSIYNKIEEITRIYKDHNELWLSYYDLIIPLMESKFIKNLNKVFMFLKNNIDIVNFVRYYSDNKNKYDNLKYASFIINEYLNKDENLYLEEFLFNFNINDKIFNYCIDTIYEFDIDLYNKFIKIFNKNSSNERYNYKKNLIGLSYKINNEVNNGICANSISDFFKKVPFVYSRNFSSDLLNFIKLNCPSYYDLYYDYIHINKLYKKDNNKIIDSKDLLNSNIIINNKIIERDDIFKVLSYMSNNNYPFIKIIFFDILDKYLNNKIEINEIKSIKKRKYIIC